MFDGAAVERLKPVPQGVLGRIAIVGRVVFNQPPDKQKVKLVEAFFAQAKLHRHLDKLALLLLVEWKLADHLEGVQVILGGDEGLQNHFTHIG